MSIIISLVTYAFHSAEHCSKMESCVSTTLWLGHSQLFAHMQMRIALARLLLGPAGQSASSGGQGGLLLLDEPTNHLDR